MGLRIVVLGSGTGVGKTHVAVSVLAGLRSMGLAAVGVKPIETGVRQGASVGPVSAAGQTEGETICGADVPGGPNDETDQGRLDNACTLGVSGGERTFHVKQPCRSARPYVFERAVSPHLAALADGVAIELGRIRAAIDALSDRAVVIETAGGLFSPLGLALTNFDLARALEPCRWVLVGADRLGVLHDLKATQGYARALGRGPDVVVLSSPPPHDGSTGTNAVELKRLRIATVVAVFPPAPVSSRATLEAGRLLAEILIGGPARTEVR